MPRRARFYQQEAHDAVFAALDRGVRRMLVGMPCGTGKSFLIAMLLKRFDEIAPHFRMMVCINSKKLVKQDAATLYDYWPYAGVGIYCDGLGKKESHYPITIGTIQSMYGSAFLFGKINVLLIDEAQCISPDEETIYKKFINDLMDANPNLIIIGLSATLYRSKGGQLVEHGLFESVVYDITGWKAFQYLVEQGYLVRLTSNPTDFSYDVTKIKSSGDDYNQKQLQEAVNTPEKNERAMREAIRRGEGRKHWLIFCAGIKHVEAIVKLMQSWGYSCVGAHSKMPEKESDANIEAYEKGEVQILVSDNMITVGFDAPFTDHIVVLRPSKAVVRHVQGLGRGTRPYYAPGYDLDTIEGRIEALRASGRENCLVSDFGKNLERLGPINDPKVPGKKTDKGDLPIKICTTDKLVFGIPRGNAVGCGCYNFAAARKCEECHELFIFDTSPKIDADASKAVATRLSTADAMWIEVMGVDYEVFKRIGARPTMRVKYRSGSNIYTELVSVEHELPYVRHMSNEWWRARGETPPLTTQEGMALVDGIVSPNYILVHFLRHPRIVSVSFENEMPVLDVFPNPLDPNQQQEKSA